ncbi:MAG: hypothetical protein HY738_22155 [Bacteroidia bacterium]|nr:hypothetical protein [Bacteroidia bacterium]
MEDKAFLNYHSVISYTLTTNPFGIGDDWFWGGGFGKCGQYDPTGQSSDAAQEIKAEVLNAIGPQPFATEYFMWCQVQTVVADWHDNYTNSLGQELMWHKESYNQNDPHPCIYYNQMNFYYNGLITVITVKAKPAGKQYIDLASFGGWQIFSDPILYRCHRALIQYGVKHTLPLAQAVLKSDQFSI